MIVLIGRTPYTCIASDSNKRCHDQVRGGDTKQRGRQGNKRLRMQRIRSALPPKVSVDNSNI